MELYKKHSAYNSIIASARSVKSLSKHLSKYVEDKIETIRSKFLDKLQNVPSVKKQTEIRSKIIIFERATEDEFKKLILSSSSKSRDLDSISTRMLKYCLDIIINPITDTINILEETSTFPQNFKEAHVRPLLKEIKKYRSVSNLIEIDNKHIFVFTVML